MLDINNGASISTVELSNILELLIGYLLCRFKRIPHFALYYIPFIIEKVFCLFYRDLSMISLYEFIDCILQGFITNEFRFLLNELCKKRLDKLLPVKDMLSDLSIQLLNPSLFDQRTNTFFIDEFAEFIFNFPLNLLYPWMQGIINLIFYNVYAGLIKASMLIKDNSYFLNNHFFIFCHHLRVFKIVSNQFLSELKKENVFLSLLKRTVLSQPNVAIGKFPEFLGELEPSLQGIGGCVYLFGLMDKR